MAIHRLIHADLRNASGIGEAQMCGWTLFLEETASPREMTEVGQKPCVLRHCENSMLIPNIAVKDHHGVIDTKEATSFSDFGK